MLVSRPKNIPTPCSKCPKGGPENEHLYMISPKNKKFMDLYRRSKDKYFEMPEHLKGCKVRQELTYKVDQIEGSRVANKTADKIAYKLAKVIKPI